MREILASEPFKRLVPEGMAAAVWAASYAERQVGVPPEAIEPVMPAAAPEARK